MYVIGDIVVAVVTRDRRLLTKDKIYTVRDTSVCRTRNTHPLCCRCKGCYIKITGVPEDFCGGRFVKI